MIHQLVGYYLNKVMLSRLPQVLFLGESVAIANEIDWIPTENLKQSKSAELSIVASVHPDNGSSNQLVYHPKSIAIGIGCIRGCDTEELRNLVFDCLKKANLTIDAVSCFVSLDLKADELAFKRIS